MKKLLLSIVIICSIFSYSAFGQVATHVVIAEIYAGGGNSGASPFTYDYIVLYNPTGSAVDVSTWSLQYSSTSYGLPIVYEKTDLVGSIPAGSYYLLQFKSGGHVTNPLPYYPDVINNTIALKKSIGKVALVNNQTKLSADPTLPNANIIDFVGYGTADVWEGASRWTEALGDRRGIRRKTNSGDTTYNYGTDGSGWDSDTNSVDFYSQNDLLLLPNQPYSTSPRANHVVIAEVYGGGGPTGSYRYDYVVLYNSSGITRDLSTWSLQYYNGSTWAVENLAGSIAPDAYYLIQLADGGSGNLLPIGPDITGSTDIGVTDGVVALVRDQNAITNTVIPFPNDQDIVDLIGYGSGTLYEGTVGTATSPGLTSSLRRKDNSGANTYGSNGSGWDSNNNSTNHYTQNSPVPLPVELTSFTATTNDNTVILEWETETEVNNYGFEIQRTSDMAESNYSNWQNIGFVEGHGNTNSPKVYTFIDDKPNSTSSLAYRLKQVDNDGSYEYSSIVEVSFVPSEFVLYQNYPNPFNPSTKIKYSIAVESYVRIKVFDNIGNEVATLVSSKQAAGNYEINFSAINLASGIYFYRMQAGSYIQMKKMMILK